MTAYYNEIDPYAAEWLRNLIKAGHIAAGDVDERSIEDVRPDDLRGYTQCHFFAGIGVWSYALRRAGWSDDRSVWTGSCPCQPFSAAGKGIGFADERHLWPAWLHLISELRPATVFGEQVASEDGLTWLDLVQADVEGLGYACAPVPFPAAGVGAPHIRDRLYFMADAHYAKRRSGRAGRHIGNWAHAGRKEGASNTEGHCSAGELADARGERVRTAGCSADAQASAGVQRADGEREWIRPDAGTGDMSSGTVGNTDNSGLEGRRLSAKRAGELLVGTPGVAGHWADCDWIYCTDGKWRPVEPGTFPLVNEFAGRVEQLRAYGNAIVAEAAATFIAASMETLEAA